MPAATRYVPPTSSERGQYAEAVARERIVRKTAYQNALKYYEGKHSQPIAIEEDEPDDNVIINMVKMTADRTVSFLFPSMPQFIIDPATLDDTPEEAWLKRFFLANGGLKALTKLALRGFLSGHCFVWVKPIPANEKGKRKYPTFKILDPTAVTIYWRADDAEDVLWYEIRYLEGTTPVIKDFVREAFDRWTIYTYRGQPLNRKDEAIPSSFYNIDMIDFKSTVFEEIGRYTHTAEIPPIIDFPHLPHPSDFYGLNEIGVSEVSLQDTINRIASEMNRIIRENADPVDVLTGSSPDEIEYDGGIVAIGNPNARVTRLEMKSDLENVSTQLDKLMETYLAVARVVLLKGDAKDLQRVTNASVRTLFLDAIAKNAIIQDSYGQGLANIAKVALMMAYADGLISTNPLDTEITIRFGTPLPTDLLEVANINGMALAGKYMSRATAATKLNLDWGFETAAMEAFDKELWDAEAGDLTPEEPTV